MAKKLGKVILTSSILAGAALGTYMYFKKEGVIDENVSVSENAANIRNKVTADAADFLNRDRSYVDLGPDDGESADPANTKAQVKDKVSKAFDQVKTVAGDTAAQVKDKVTKAIDQFKESAAEAKEAAAEAAEDAGDKIEDAVEEAKDAVEEVAEKAEDKIEEVKEAAEDTFEPGLAADKIDTAESKTLGSTVSEEFFNDEN